MTIPVDRKVATDDSTTAPLPPQLSGIGIAILLCGAVLPFLDQFIVNVALPSINSTLMAPQAMLELTVAGYGTAYALFLIVGGRLGDAYGRRTVFITGLAGFTLSSLLCGLAPNIDVLVSAHCAQGVSAAMIMPQVLGTFRATLSGRRQGEALGLYGATAGISAVAGQLIGGLLIAANIGGELWRPIFLVNVPVGFFAVVAAWRLVPNTRSSNPASVDLLGTALFGLTMLCLLIPFTEGRSLGWPLWTWIILAISPLAAVATYLVERRTERCGGSPLLAPSLFAVRSMRRGSGGAVHCSGKLPPATRRRTRGKRAFGECGCGGLTVSASRQSGRAHVPPGVRSDPKAGHKDLVWCKGRRDPALALSVFDRREPSPVGIRAFRTRFGGDAALKPRPCQKV